MQLEYTGILYALSFALDAVEREVNGQVDLRKLGKSDEDTRIRKY